MIHTFISSVLSVHAASFNLESRSAQNRWGLKGAGVQPARGEVAGLSAPGAQPHAANRSPSICSVSGRRAQGDEGNLRFTEQDGPLSRKDKEHEDLQRREMTSNHNPFSLRRVSGGSSPSEKGRSPRKNRLQGDLTAFVAGGVTEKVGGAITKNQSLVSALMSPPSNSCCDCSGWSTAAHLDHN